jgi:ornithine lipid ester-linked acyl 2-hydroxylase
VTAPINRASEGGAASAGMTQRHATQGIHSLTRLGVISRTFMMLVAGAERLNLAYSKVGNPCVYDTKVFPWAASIEREWRAIRQELEKVLVRKDDLPGFQEIATDVAAISRDRGWKTFLLTGYGIRSQRNIAACPQTWRILQNVPGLKTAMFSIFEPGKQLPAHRGPYNGVLRLHLGLIVPEPHEAVGIRIGPHTCHWQEGRVLIFDDAFEHEAWNRTNRVRVVLFVDFVKPLRFPASLLNWLLLNSAVFTPFVREGYDNQRRWERRFYRKS